MIIYALQNVNGLIKANVFKHWDFSSDQWLALEIEIF